MALQLTDPTIVQILDNEILDNIIAHEVDVNDDSGGALPQGTSKKITALQRKIYSNTFSVLSRDAAGKPTFYASIQAAIAGSSNGDKIDFYHDVTENLVCEINLSFNGHGNTINGRFANVSNAIVCSMVDMHFLYDAPDNVLITEAGSEYNLSGVTITNDDAGGRAILNNGNMIGGIAYGRVENSAGGTMRSLNAVFSTSVPVIENIGEIDSCVSTNTGIGDAIFQTGGNMTNCTGRAEDGRGIRASSGLVSGCVALSNGSLETLRIAGTAYGSNCTGFNTVGIGAMVHNGDNIVGRSLLGIGALYKHVSNSKGLSFGDVGILAYSDANLEFCSGESSANLGGQIETGAGHGTLTKCSFKSTFDSVNGSAFDNGAANTRFGDCSFRTTNASAYAITAGSTYDIYEFGSKRYTQLGLHANLTNIETATADDQGNVFLT